MLYRFYKSGYVLYIPAALLTQQSALHAGVFVLQHLQEQQATIETK